MRPIIRYVFCIIYSIVVLLFIVVSIFVGIISIRNGGDPSQLFFISITIAFIFILWGLVSRQRSNYVFLRNGLKKDVSIGLTALREDAAKLLSSKVETKDSKEAIVEVISELYYSMALQVRERKKANKRNLERVIIILFGASDVQPKSVDQREVDDSEIVDSPYDKFVNAREAAEDQDILFYRYVRLFDEKNFIGRSREIRDAYVRWISYQITTMERSNLYTLFNARRAPRWKAIRSSIISEHMYIDILGDGDSGFVVRGEDFARTQKRNADKFILSNKGGRKSLLGRFSHENVGELRKHYDLMKSINTKIEKENG